ncbi:MAG: hypothetical protein LWX01_01505 [Deltaproteobacteria bacterium]|nr:hypothetical protein [Deltaproteobacteria bacterium]MDL1960377.1 hypothetical protein [Deltaproteobacteria bacterium]
MHNLIDQWHLDQGQVGREILAIIGSVPRRWGRMDLLSRMAVVAVGRAFCDSDLLNRQTNKIHSGNTVGLIAGTRWGSLITDLAFCETLGQGPELASPTVFSYTLPNIALAEAAGHFGLTGPVYSIFAEHDLMEKVEQEAFFWLSNHPEISAMVAGRLDIPPSYAEGKAPVAEFHIVNGKCRT